jgi:hypothetical protein
MVGDEDTQEGESVIWLALVPVPPDQMWCELREMRLHGGLAEMLVGDAGRNPLVVIAIERPERAHEVAVWGAELATQGVQIRRGYLGHATISCAFPARRETVRHTR